MHLLIAFGVCPQTDRHTDFIDENPGAYLLQANLRLGLFKASICDCFVRVN